MRAVEPRPHRSARDDQPGCELLVRESLEVAQGDDLAHDAGTTGGSRAERAPLRSRMAARIGAARNGRHSNSSASSSENAQGGRRRRMRSKEARTAIWHNQLEKRAPNRKPAMPRKASENASWAASRASLASPVIRRQMRWTTSLWRSCSTWKRIVAARRRAMLAGGDESVIGVVQGFLREASAGTCSPRAARRSNSQSSSGSDPSFMDRSTQAAQESTSAAVLGAR